MAWNVISLRLPVPEGALSLTSCKPAGMLGAVRLYCVPSSALALQDLRRFKCNH